MRLMTRPVWMLLAFAVFGSGAFADVLVLKDGRKVSGRVKESKEGFEVLVDGQTLAFSKGDVVERYKSPREFLGNVDERIEAAKGCFKAGLEKTDPEEADRQFRAGVAEITRARDAYAEARDLWPTGYPELDEKLVYIMSLMRLLRDRLGSQYARAPQPAPAPAPARPSPAPAPAPRPVAPVPAPRPVAPPPTVAPRVSRPAVRKGPLIQPAAAPEHEAVKSPLTTQEAFAVLVDPESRRDERRRADARSRLREDWLNGGRHADLAGAGYVFLSRDQRDWGLVQDVVFVKGPGFENTYRGKLVKTSDEISMLYLAGHKDVRIRRTEDGVYVRPPGGSSYKALEFKVTQGERSETYGALQEVLEGLGGAGLVAQPDGVYSQGAGFLQQKIRNMTARDSAAPVDSLNLFLAALASTVVASRKGEMEPSLARPFEAAGVRKSEYGAIWGRPAGLAMDDFRKWVATDDFRLGLVQYDKDYRKLRDFEVQYAYGLLMMFRAVADNRDYRKAASYLEKTARSSGTVPREHLSALAKSIRSNSPCRVCLGTHKVNCLVCRGKGTANLQCRACGGSGLIASLRSGTQTCKGCSGKGRWFNVECPRCKTTGKIPCKARGCIEPVPRPRVETFADIRACELCVGRGSIIRHVAYPCPRCAGVGLWLRPRQDPQKTLH